MRALLRRSRFPILLLILAASAASPGAFAEETTVGVAVETFKLPLVGVPLAGYSRRHGQASTGQRDALGARALVIRSGETAVALVSCDLLIIDETLFQAVRQQLDKRMSSPRPVLFISATHTHSGPGGYGKKFFEKISMGHYDPRTFDALVTAITRAVYQADQERKPMTLGCGTATTRGLVKNRVEEGGFADADLAVCGLLPAGSPTPAAIVVNFSAHPTTLGAWNRQLAGDYPAVVADRLKQVFPKSETLFFAGAVGDQAPVKSGEGFGRAAFIGEPLAQQAAGVLARLKPESPSPVRVAQEVFPLPPARVRLNRRLALPRWLGQTLVDDDATLSVALIGKLAWFGVPCDLSSALGRQLKEAALARGLFPVIAGFTDDYIGYCMPESVYRTGEYEALMAFNGPATGRLLVERLIDMLEKLSPLHP